MSIAKAFLPTGRASGCHTNKKSTASDSLTVDFLRSIAENNTLKAYKSLCDTTPRGFYKTKPSWAKE